MNRADIITIVRAKIDEINPDAQANVQLGSVFGIIETILEESANTLLMKVPLHKQSTYQFSDFTDQYPPFFGPITQDWGFFDLPDDYLRLSYFKMIEWQVPVTDAISEENPLYRQQFNKFLKGKPYNPVCAIGYPTKPGSLSSKRRLMYFSMPGGNHRIEVGRYIKRIMRPDEIPSPNPKNYKDITSLPNNLIEPLTWQAAGDVLVAMLKGDLANLAYAKAQEFINTNTR